MTRRAAGRVSWGLADQALSSLTNFALNLLMARALGGESFGAFALVFGVYTFLLGLGRSMTSEPLVVRHSASSPAAWSAAMRAAAGTSVVLGVVGGALCLGADVALGGRLGGGFAALAVALPGLLLQDTWRFSLVAGSRARSAFVNDLIWAVSLVPLLGLVLVSGRGTVFWLTLAWGAAATVAALAGSVQTRTLPWPLEAGAWLRRNRKLWRCYGPESIVTSGTQLVLVYAIGWLTGLAGLGAIQAAGLLLGPLNVLFMAAGLIVVPELVRLAARSPRLVGPASWAVTLGLSMLVLLTGAVLLTLPETIGSALLGSTWDPARAVLAPLVLMTAGTSLASGAQFGLRALAAARRSLLANLGSSSVLVTSTVVGAVLDGAAGAAWGLAVGRCLGLAVWWPSLAGALRRCPPAEPARHPRLRDVVRSSSSAEG